MKQPLSAALYLRLSNDDAEYGESVSIETQRKILRAYATENHIPVYSEYSDEGYSGTNFDRPAFRRMMEDIDAGRVNCVITKDLSRFGREYIQVGRYLEVEFPTRGIRYIAVTDGEDSDKGLSDFLPFKNLFNEWFAKDTSRKVRSALRAKFQAGEHTCAMPPLGYRKDPDRRNHLLPDDRTKWIIEKIFLMAVQGTGASSIAHSLYRERIPKPTWWNYQLHGASGREFEGKPENERYTWSAAHINRILHNQTYLGHSVHLRMSKISFKAEKRVTNAPEDWMIVKNTHEPLVDEDMFLRIQELMRSRRRTRADGTRQIFSGLLRCADCGHTMSYETMTKAKTPYSFYRCRKYTEGMHQCTSHYIRYETLYDFVLARLQNWTKRASLDESAIIASLQQTVQQTMSSDTRHTQDELSRLTKRQHTVDGLLARIYEDRMSGEITERSFTALREKYQHELEELDAQIERLETELNESAQQTDNIRQWVTGLQQYTDMMELTVELLNALIDRIDIHEPVKGSDGQKQQTIDIYYRYVGKID